MSKYGGTTSMSLKQLARAAVMVGVFVTLLADVPLGAIAVGGIGGRPANPDPDNPRTQSIFVFTLDRGETGRDEVLVVNNSDKTQTIRLYAVDGLTTNTGSYTCRQEADARMGLGKWTTISKSEVTLEPSTTTEVPFEISMPSNADVGEHNGCVVFESKDDPNAEEAEGGNVQIKTRQALRVAVTVPGDLKRDIAIDEFSSATVDGKPSYTLSVSNNGNVSADVDLSVVVRSLIGGEIYSNGGGYPVLSDTDLTVNYDQQDTPMFGGFYTAKATVSYAEEIGTIGNEDGPIVTKESDEKLIFIAPSGAGAAILLIAAVAVLLLAAWYVRRYLMHKKIVKAGGTHVVKDGDTIQSVADQYNMNWKRLASYNKIRAPYTLKEGQTLHVSAPKHQKQ